MLLMYVFFFFNQKTAYEIRISDWSSDVCSSDLPVPEISFWNAWKGSRLDTRPVANVWLRNKVTLTAEQASQGGSLSIGAIDALDPTFVNGHPVGYTFGWGVERTYRIPADRKSTLLNTSN